MSPDARWPVEEIQPRRRGRPRGALQADVLASQLGLHHFAFLRSVCQGIDPAKAAAARSDHPIGRCHHRCGRTASSGQLGK
jgi:hypothetical protein